MSSRHPAYWTLVLLLSLIFSLPQLLVSVSLGFQAYQQGWRFWAPSGFLSPTYYSPLSYTPFWHDTFLITANYETVNGQLKCNFQLMDPETGQSTDPGWHVLSSSGIHPLVFGDRLFLIGSSGVREVVDGVPVVSNLAIPMIGYQDGTRLEFEGEPAVIQHNGRTYDILNFGATTPVAVGTVVLPDPQREWTIDKTTVNFRQVHWMTCVVVDGQTHLFVQLNNGPFLHRAGMDVERSRGVLPRPTSATSPGPAELPVSALHAANTNGEIAGWSLINHSARIDADVSRQQGLVIAGRPAALVVEGVGTTSPMGRLLQFDGTRWSEFTTLNLPFGSKSFRALPARDGQRSYLVVSTSTGVEHIYVVDASGVRETKYVSNTMNPMLNSLLGWPTFVLVLSGFGFVLGLLAGCLMWWFTRPDYGFGLQHVALASLGRRGLARLIDVGLILLSTYCLGWALTVDLDWLAAAEAFNLNVSHPAKTAAENVAIVLLIWVVVLQITLLLTQAWWGITPGKWCCGLRILRTTLQPCGLARAVTREVLFYWVDAVSFLCWTPGILAIAFTDRRQRLGDFVADTIVVTRRSLIDSPRKGMNDVEPSFNPEPAATGCGTSG